MTHHMIYFPLHPNKVWLYPIFIYLVYHLINHLDQPPFKHIPHINTHLYVPPTLLLKGFSSLKSCINDIEGLPPRIWHGFHLQGYLMVFIFLLSCLLVSVSSLFIIVMQIFPYMYIWHGFNPVVPYLSKCSLDIWIIADYEPKIPHTWNCLILLYWRGF